MRKLGHGYLDDKAAYLVLDYCIVVISSFMFLAKAKLDRIASSELEVKCTGTDF